MENKIVEIIKQNWFNSYPFDNPTEGEMTERGAKNAANEIVKLFTVPPVSNRREQLVEFARYIQKFKNDGLDYDCVEREVDSFLNQ